MFPPRDKEGVNRPGITSSGFCHDLLYVLNSSQMLTMVSAFWSLETWENDNNDSYQKL